MLNQLKLLMPDIKFQLSNDFCWSPNNQTITYSANLRSKSCQWALLHECGHALLNHQSYTNDFQLIKMENTAWEQAKIIASKLNLTIDETHIQDCLDSYRDWLNYRSTCPKCRLVSTQNNNSNEYYCYNCHTNWRVTNSKFCRVYRSVKNNQQKILI